jgi:hypothetical protein
MVAVAVAAAAAGTAAVAAGMAAAAAVVRAIPLLRLLMSFTNKDKIPAMVR